MRKCSFVVLLFAFLATLPARAGEDGLTGFWKFSFYQGANQTYFWLLRLDSKDGKLIAKVEPLRDGPDAKIESIQQTGDLLQMKIRATFEERGQRETITFQYEGKLPKAGAKKILGSISGGNAAFPVVMEATSAKTPFEVEKEILTRTPNDPKAFVAILAIIATAKENKIDNKDLQEMVNSSLKAGAAYGPLYQLTHGMRLLRALSADKTYAPVKLEVARQIAKQIDPKSSPATQLQALTTLADVLRAGDKKDEAKALEVRVDKLEASAYADYSKDALNFKVQKFAGRKGKSKRAVLVELFTGAMCPPCVAADMGFDGLEKAYSDKDVVLLQYHMNIPRPEPMSNTDSESRLEYYIDNYRKKVGASTPTILFGGKPEAPGGGSREEAQEKFAEYSKIVNKMLEDPSDVEITASAVRTDDKIEIKAKVSGLAKPGAAMRLRLALVEDWVRFRGSNGMQYHHRVVRALPGGNKGFTLKQKDSEHSASVDLTELRRKLNKYLDDVYSDGPRPLRLRDLHVVAFVQDDESTAVLHAVDVPVKDGK